MTINQAIGRISADMRKRKRISLDDLARSMGHTVKYVSAIEDGQKNLTLDKADDLAYALGMTLYELIDMASNEMEKQ